MAVGVKTAVVLAVLAIPTGCSSAAELAESATPATPATSKPAQQPTTEPTAGEPSTKPTGGPTDTLTVQPSKRPRVGDCFATTDLLLTENYDPTKAGPCDRAHTLETFAVIDVRQKLTGRTLAQHGRRCDAPARDFLGGEFHATRIAVFYFGPPPEEADTLGWVRCDVGVISNTGAVSVEQRTGSLQGVLQQKVPVRYRGCLGERPKRQESQDFVSCRKRHVTQMLPLIKVLGGPDAGYPGQAELVRKYSPWCRRLANTVQGAARHSLTVPVEEGWTSYGKREAICWAVAAPGKTLPGL